MSDNNFNEGSWVMYNDYMCVIHGATTVGKYLIDCQSKINPEEVMRTWARRENLTPLDPAVSSLLSSIYNHQK